MYGHAKIKMTPCSVLTVTLKVFFGKCRSNSWNPNTFLSTTFHITVTTSSSFMRYHYVNGAYTAFTRRERSVLNSKNVLTAFVFDHTGVFSAL
jgi:hypothetical protein